VGSEDEQFGGVGANEERDSAEDGEYDDRWLMIDHMEVSIMSLISLRNPYLQETLRRYSLSCVT